MVRPRRLRPFFALTLVVLLSAPLLSPGVVAAFGTTDQATAAVADTGRDAAEATALGTTVVVPAGETTTGSATASGARVVVAGRHEGDLKLYGGTVVVAGTVTGDVQAFGAEVRVTGTVGGSLVAYGGTVELAESGHVENLFNAGGSRVLVSGSVNDSVQATGGRVILGDSARVTRDVTYDATFVDRGGTVTGETTRTDRFLGPVGTLLRSLRLLPVLAPALGLVAGLAGRRWLPTTAAALSDSLVEDPRRSLVSGLGALLGAGVVALSLVLSVVGLPLLVVLASLAALGALLGLAVTQWTVGRVVLDRVAPDRGLTSLAPAVGCGVGLLVGIAAVVAGGPLSWAALGLLAVAAVVGVGAVARRVRETGDVPAVVSRFG